MFLIVTTMWSNQPVGASSDKPADFYSDLAFRVDMVFRCLRFCGTSRR